MKFTFLRKIYTALDVTYLRIINNHFFSVIFFVISFFFFPRRKKPTLNVENIIGLQVSTGESDQRSPGFLTALTFAFLSTSLSNPLTVNPHAILAAPESLSCWPVTDPSWPGTSPK